MSCNLWKTPLHIRERMRLEKAKTSQYCYSKTKRVLISWTPWRIWGSPGSLKHTSSIINVFIGTKYLFYLSWLTFLKLNRKEQEKKRKGREQKEIPTCKAQMLSKGCAYFHKYFCYSWFRQRQGYRYWYGCGYQFQFIFVAIGCDHKILKNSLFQDFLWRFLSVRQYLAKCGAFSSSVQKMMCGCVLYMDVILNNALSHSDNINHSCSIIFQSF